MRLLSIDRIENGFAVCENENKTFENIPLEMLPQGVKEGDVLRQDENGFALDREETQRRRKQAFDLLNKLLNQ